MKEPSVVVVASPSFVVASGRRREHGPAAQESRKDRTISSRQNSKSAGRAWNDAQISKTAGVTESVSLKELSIRDVI